MVMHFRALGVISHAVYLDNIEPRFAVGADRKTYIIDLARCRLLAERTFSCDTGLPARLQQSDKTINMRFP